MHSKIYQLRENNLLIIKSFFVSVTIKIRYGHGVEAQKVLLLPVTSCFGAQEVLIAFALFGIIWACTISTVHWTQRAIAQVTHPARFTFTLHPGLDTRAMLAGKPRETWLHFFAVGSIPSREATGTCYAISSAISVFTSSIWLTADTFAAFSCILPYPPSWVTVTTLLLTKN